MGSGSTDWREEMRQRDDEVRARTGRLGKASREHARALWSPLYADRDRAATHEEIVAEQADRARKRTLAVRYLDGAPVRTRRAVLRSLHPGFADLLTDWWQWSIERGFLGPGLRAPNQPDLTVRQREQRFVELSRSLVGNQLDIHDLAARLEQSRTADLVAAAIDRSPDGDRVFATVCEIVRGDHPSARVSGGAVQVLLMSSRDEGWELVEQLLLAAQRQEGLRNTILDALDVAHTEAFERLVHVVVDHDLLRFAGPMRAAQSWLRLPLTAKDRDTAREYVRAFAAAQRYEGTAPTTRPPLELYLHLLSRSRRDVSLMRAEANALVHGEPQLEQRLIGAHMLMQIMSVEPDVHGDLWSLIDDEDLRLAALACNAGPPAGIDGFDALSRLLERFPQRAVSFEPFPVRRHPWKLKRAFVRQRLISSLGDREISELGRWEAEMGDADTFEILRACAARQSNLSSADRAFVIGCLSNTNQQMQSQAVSVLEQAGIVAGDVESLEPLLCSPSEHQRKRMLDIFTDLPFEWTSQTVRRLWKANSERQRDSAAELTSLLEPSEELDQLVASLLDDSPTDRQQRWLSTARDAGDIDQLFGADWRDDLTTPTQPELIESPLSTDFGAALQLVQLFDEFFETHRNLEVRSVRKGEDATALLGDIGFGSWRTKYDWTEVDQLLEAWWSSQPKSELLADELIWPKARILVGQLPGVSLSDDDDGAQLIESLRSIRHVGLLGRAITLVAPTDASLSFELVIATAEREGALLSPEELESTIQRDPRTSYYQQDRITDVRGRSEVAHWTSTATQVLLQQGQQARLEDVDRTFRLARWLERPLPDSSFRAMNSELLISAFERGIATRADVLDGFINSTRLLADLTSREETAVNDLYPKAVALAHEIRRQVLEAELHRGEHPLPTSELVSSIGAVENLEHTFRFLATVEGPLHLNTYNHFHGHGTALSRSQAFNFVLQRSHPPDHLDIEELRQLAARYELEDLRLAEFAIRVPRWLPIIEEALGWSGFESAARWLIAHGMPGFHENSNSSWTPLTREDLADGAIDVDWFFRCHQQLGPERWQAVFELFERSRDLPLLVNAMLGRLEPADVITRIQTKRHQKSVVALGLLPLPSGAGREPEIQRRYEVLLDFAAGSRKFGSQRRENEANAVRLATQNLARTAGYGDVQRFSWAMEAASIADLAGGPVVVEIDDLSLTLAVNDDGQSSLSIKRKDRELKHVPKAVRKDPAVASIVERAKQLEGQARRVRRSLESAMVSCDEFEDEEFLSLRSHPIVAPMLTKLVVVDERGRLSRPENDHFRGPTGRKRKTHGKLRVAHPVDLLKSNEWDRWQEDFMANRRRQPFKQVFRELYLPIHEERNHERTRRYEGHQIQPTQARSLLEKSGWEVVQDDHPRRHFHSSGLTATLAARLHAAEGFDQLPEIGSASFRQRGARHDLPLEDVPAVAFSEVMRDIDLVVSVAHAGGVDPEASLSTLEVRRALVRETCRLFQLQNVEFTDNHALISGSRAEYSVHLGSGVTHQRRGRAMTLIAAPTQDRGRVFLPFFDSDPAASRIVSTVLLLSRDEEILDPTVLRQIDESTSRAT